MMLNLGELKRHVTEIVAQGQRICRSKEKQHQDAQRSDKKVVIVNIRLVRSRAGEVEEKPHEAAECRNENSEVAEYLLFPMTQGI
jgi:hypothetical protein